MGDVEYDNHENRLMFSLQQMMRSEHFADVVICCADGYKLRAHKVVLAYCSSYLQTLFLGHPGPDDSVTIILQDVGHEDVERVLEFVYTGAAVVPGHGMDGFVTTAGALGIGPLLDPRRHLEMSEVRQPPRQRHQRHSPPLQQHHQRHSPPPQQHQQHHGPPRHHQRHGVPQCADQSPPHRYQQPQHCNQRPPTVREPERPQHPCPRVRQPPRTTGILTPSPWAQNTRPPCAAPKYTPAACRTAAAVAVAPDPTPAACPPTTVPGLIPSATPPLKAVEIQKERLPTPATVATPKREEPSPPPSLPLVPTPPPPPPVGDDVAETNQKPVTIACSDANNNGIPEGDRNAANQAKSHACQECQKTFVTKASLKIHQRTHTGEKPFVCESCGKQFSQLRNYKYHRSVHEGTREFSGSCPECGKLFNDRGYLSSHMKIHRNRKEYGCEHCGKSFNQRVAYNMHVRIHTGERPHRCHHCGKSFTRKMLLKQHLRTHTGEKPFACAVCHKPFADRSNMTLHMRLHSGVKPYACAVCAKSFTKKHHLKTHMNYHTGVKPYACGKCGLTFSQSSNMRTHLKKCNASADAAAAVPTVAATDGETAAAAEGT